MIVSDKPRIIEVVIESLNIQNYILFEILFLELVNSNIFDIVKRKF